MEYAMELRDLRKEYKEFTLDNISLSLPMGCIMGFIGENGAGKSTTIKAMLGLIRPDGGSIRLLGQDPASSRAVMEQVGVVLDAGFFPPEMNPKQLGKALGRIYKGWQPAAYDDYLRRFEIAPGKKIKAFSRGMVMKLSLAVALSHGAKLLVLDEATSGLDPIIRDDILDILYDFIQDEEHSVFLSSHITGDLEKIADYLAFIHQGKVLMAGEGNLWPVPLHQGAAFGAGAPGRGGLPGERLWRHRLGAAVPDARPLPGGKRQLRRHHAVQHQGQAPVRKGILRSCC